MARPANDKPLNRRPVDRRLDSFIDSDISPRRRRQIAANHLRNGGLAASLDTFMKAQLAFRVNKST